jgi:hypothetical protein
MFGHWFFQLYTQYNSCRLDLLSTVIPEFDNNLYVPYNASLPSRLVQICYQQMEPEITRRWLRQLNDVATFPEYASLVSFVLFVNRSLPFRQGLGLINYSKAVEGGVE